MKLMSEQEDISRSEKLGDEASSGQPASSNAPSEEPGDPAPAVAEQSVLEPFAAVAEARPRGGLVNLMARISPDPRAVHDAWVDLRSMIQEIVRREIQALDTRIEAKIDGVKAQIDGLEAKVESLRAEFVMMRWMLGILSAAVIGLLGVIVALFIFFASDRMDSRPEIDQVEQTREATLPAPGGVVADEPATSASEAKLGTDTEPTGSPGDADSLEHRDTR